jgi:hypothetical protein
MIHYKKYLVKTNDQFDPQQFSFIEDEINLIMEQTRHVSGISRPQILVAYLRDHSVDQKWAGENPELAQLLGSGSFPSNNIELLFDACQDNNYFRQQMEAFLLEGFSGSR